ncbi:MAG TPA: Tad domain-containing protein [Gaiellaceae bacterium]|jgi:Flp pilus assembly protein TadG|nr:Tad domain-containing protein [Gaiellaceae bacterium]
MTNLRRQEGQVTVLVAVFMVVLVGLAGFAIDVGSWFRQQRASQSTVDSAALAGAQSLPDDTAGATAMATTYAGKNGGAAGAAITFTSRYAPNDTITVQQTRPAAGFFSSLLGISTVTVRARASAVSELPTAVMGAAPIAVDIRHPMLSGNGCPCFSVPTTIDLDKKGVPGAFGMIDLAMVKGNTGTSTLADWIANGYNQYLPLGDYDSDPGAKFNSSQIQAALQGKYGSDLLFPVYDSLAGNGSNAKYHVVGWAAFHVTLSQASGNSGSISGWFDRVIWQGIVPSSGPAVMPDLGVHSVALVD